jgi:hypothetical protein
MPKLENAWLYDERNLPQHLEFQWLRLSLESPAHAANWHVECFIPHNACVSSLMGNVIHDAKPQ